MNTICKLQRELLSSNLLPSKWTSHHLSHQSLLRLLAVTLAAWCACTVSAYSPTHAMPSAEWVGHQLLELMAFLSRSAGLKPIRDDGNIPSSSNGGRPVLPGRQFNPHPHSSSVGGQPANLGTSKQCLNEQCGWKAYFYSTHSTLQVSFGSGVPIQNWPIHKQR